MHSVTCYSTVLDFNADAHCHMHFLTRLAWLKAGVQPACRDGLILDALLAHLLFGHGLIDQIHHGRVPGLDHGERVLGHEGAVIEEADRLVPGGVGLVMEMRYMVLSCMIVFLAFVPGPPSRPGQGGPGRLVVHKTMMQQNVPVYILLHMYTVRVGVALQI